MDIMYWLLIRNIEGDIVDIQEARWGYFFNRNGDFRVHIKKQLRRAIRNKEVYEFGIKSNFVKRGIINPDKERK